MYGFSEPADITVRFWVYFLAQGKFFSMFTLLFGAGFYIFLERLETKDYGLSSFDIYSRRLLILFLIGVIHAYFIWDGDVLYHYVACGFLLFPFRSMSISRLLLVVGVLAAILFFNSWQRTLVIQKQYKEYTQAIETPEDQRSYQEQKSVELWQAKTRKKDLGYIELSPRRKTIMDSWKANFDKVHVHTGLVFFQGILFRTLITMIVGIILYKSGIFHNYRNFRHYCPLTLLVLSVALLMNYSKYSHLTYTYYEPVQSVALAWWHTLAKEILGIAYILLFNGLYQKFLRNIPFKPISNLGRMALSNYIFQSLLCGLLFYGYGLAWFNQFSRSQLWEIIPLIWLLQLILSSIWLKFFSQGPLEYVWRKLTY